MKSWIPVRGVDIDLTEAQELANMDAKTFVGLMDTGVLSTNFLRLILSKVL